MKVLVTGGAGFIGSHAVDALLAKGHGVTALDNLSGGKKEFIARHMDNPKFRFVHNDLLDRANIRDALKGHDAVWHLAAKPDVRTYTAEDLEKDVRITENVLDAMAKSGVRRIIFSSSSAVYGEAKQVPTPEDAPLRPISKYGESKVACERLVSKYCSEQGARCWIFRFANIVGERGTHGVIVDFINKLRKNPSELEILGDGRQSKSYLLVQDCIIGMMMGGREKQRHHKYFQSRMRRLGFYQGGLQKSSRKRCMRNLGSYLRVESEGGLAMFQKCYWR